MVKEQRGERLPGGFTDEFAGSVDEVRIVTRHDFAGDGIGPADIVAEWVTHQNRAVAQTCFFGHVRERKVGVVNVQNVVMSVVIGTIEPKEVLVDSIANKDVDPTIVVDIGATDAETGAEVCRISERRFCDFFERSVT